MLSHQPLISIVTIVRNGLPFVNDTVDSVLSQDYSQLEYWIIDGGSTDGTVEVIRRAEQQLAGWISEPDKGISDAFNKGLGRVRGDYVMFLNADDALASPQAISTLVKTARDASWPDVIYGDCDLIDRESSAVLYRAQIDYDRECFLNFAMLPHPSMLVRRSYFERHGEFDTSFKSAMDYEMLLRGVPWTGAIRVPVLVTNVRTGGESTRDPIRAVEENIRALRKNGFGQSIVWAYRVRATAYLRMVLRRILKGLNLYHFARRLLGKPMVASK